jgi:hypothetical protein
MRRLYGKVTVIVARATERDEETDRLPRQRELIVRISHLEGEGNKLIRNVETHLLSYMV